jgi:hypothetical protein
MDQREKGTEKNCGGGEICRSRPDRPWGPPSLLYNGYRVSFPGVKRPGRGVDHPPSSSARVKDRVELYLYSPSGPSWPILGRTLPLPFILPLLLEFGKQCTKQNKQPTDGPTDPSMTLELQVQPRNGDTVHLNR